MFEKELEFFVANQEALVAKHLGRYLVIRGEEVVDVHDTALDAFLAAQRRFEPGSYMIQHCEAGPGAYTVTIG